MSKEPGYEFTGERGVLRDAFAHVRSWPFWRNLTVWFCLFSVAGHWLEIGYCLVMDRLFGIVDPESLVWDDPLYPFIVYGVGVVVCAVFLVPLRDALARKLSGCMVPVFAFWLAASAVCLVMELTMGFLLNRPDPAGVYPLWDNSQLPGNVLGQAWLVNDIGLGAVATAFTFLVYPGLEQLASWVPARAMDTVAAATIVGFVALCIVKFAV